MNVRNLKVLFAVVIHTQALGGLFPGGSGWHNTHHRAIASLLEEGLIERVGGDHRGHGVSFVATAAGFAEIHKLEGVQDAV